jgi:hypothetical protein
MNRYKKDIPYNVLKKIEPYLKNTDSLFNLCEPGDSLLLIKDSDEKSDYFFEIMSYTYPNNQLTLDVKFKPKNFDTISEHTLRIKGSSLDGYFESWKNILIAYQSIKTVYDDPIIKQYTEEFFQQIKIVEVDADIASFSFDKQLLIDDYCETVSLRLGELKTDNNATNIDLLQQRIDDLRKTQSQKSKNEVVYNLANIWAIARKIGIKFFKSVFSNPFDQIQKLIEN